MWSLFREFAVAQIPVWSLRRSLDCVGELVFEFLVTPRWLTVDVVCLQMRTSFVQRQSKSLDKRDMDMPQYIADNTDDEDSHQKFLNAFLMAVGAEPVNLDAFRHLQGSTATGVDKTKVG